MLAIGLIALWAWPESRAWLQQCSLTLFAVLNGSMADAPVWSHVVAIANIRAIDLGTATIMAIFLLKGGWVVDRAAVRRVFVGFILLLIWLLLFREILLSPLSHWAGWKLPSPSMAVDGAISTASHVGPFRVKAGDHTSFPGDHAAVLFAWLGYLLLVGNLRRFWWWFVPAALLVLVMMLPRLIIGAHWLTDNLIGGVAIAALSLAWTCMTPLMGLCLDWVLPAVERSVRKLNQWWPATARWAFFDLSVER